MLRSRSSFDDLTAAIASATSLGPVKTETAPAPYQGVPLVSFSLPEGPESVAAPPPRPVVPAPQKGPVDAAPLEETVSSDAARRPPKLPDLSSVVSPIVRCEKIVEWIIEATGASDVFIADAAGLPLAGAVVDVEARLAGSGVVSSAVAQLATAIPGNTSPLFELHIGEGPFFQLVGFEVASALYLVGLTRGTPLTPRQAHAIRLACRHALGEMPTA